MEAQEIFNAITSRENLELAWGKVKRYYSCETAWKDDVEIARFSLNLQHELEKIASDYISGQYKLTKIRPIPQPKKKDVDGSYRLRQLFWIPVRDQVAWMAVVNVIGPLLDSQMPVWSFGNRLHRAVWYEKNTEGQNRLKIGPYRQSSGMTYRKFSQSWPLYRRYIYLTVRKLARKEKDALFDLSEAEQNIIYAEEHIEKIQKMPYLDKLYWNGRANKIYWASIDFEKFYPNLDLGLVILNISKYLNIKDGSRLSELLKKMIDFEIDYSDIEIRFGDISLGDRPGNFTGIPTGLMVGGFFANVAMLHIDDEVSKESKNYQVAHFRYVDDHIILAKSFDNLIAWIKKYKKNVEDWKVAKINFGKTIPESLQEYLNNPLNMEAKKRAKSDSLIDPLYPKPLMTKTLTKVSQLAKFDFEFADESEQLSIMNDLELLMLAEIGDSELPETTRISFAATLMSRFSSIDSKSKKGITEISRIKRNIFNLNYDLEKARGLWRDKKKEDRSGLALDIEDIKSKIIKEEIVLNELRIDVLSKFEDRLAKTYGLLLKSIHENPEKLRLWQRAIDFCAFTGYKGISKLQEEVRRIRDNCHVTANYIEALVLSYISEMAIKSYCFLSFENLTEASRNKKINFLADIFSTSLKWSRDINRPYYLRFSIETFCMTLVNLGESIPRLFNSGRLMENPKRYDKFYKESKKTTNLFKSYSIIIKNPSENYIAWLWWVDSIGCMLNKYEPLPVLADAMSNLSPLLPASWRLWQKYPSSISDAAISEILDARKLFDKSQQGWIFDALFQRVFASLINESEVPTNVLPVLRSLGKNNSIIYWNKFLISIEEIQLEFDPRSSEWTVLEIIDQVIDLAQVSGIAIHGANFLIPTKWFNLEEKDLIGGLQIATWESWRRIARENKISISEDGSLIEDDRIHPFNRNGDVGAWSQIRALGLLLLNLLRRDFRLPAEWNQIRGGAMFDFSIKYMIGEVQCSSLTTGILESCLLPRARETVMINELQAEILFDHDTDNDHPIINDLLTLKKYIVNAKSQLEKYQFSMQAYKPKQLIPLRIEQLSKFGRDLNVNEQDDFDE